MLLSLLAPLVAGQETSEGEDGSDQMDEEFESASRRVEVDELEGEVEVRSVGADGDRIRMRIRADEAELRLDFRTPETNFTEVELELEFRSIREYLDENGDGRFDKGETVVQDFRVDDMPFSGPVIEDVPDGSRIELTYETSGFTFRLIFWVFGNQTILNGTLVKPTEVKFDLAVQDFPFEREDSNLAVIFKLETEVEPRMSSEADQEMLEALSGRYEGFFRWSTVAEVDGRTVDVNSTVIKVETEIGGEFEVERTIALSYPQGSSVVHDPVVGIAMATTGMEMGLLGLMIIVVTVVLISVGVAIWLASRHREARS